MDAGGLSRATPAEVLHGVPPPVLPAVTELLGQLHRHLPLATGVMARAGNAQAVRRAVVSAEHTTRPKPAPDVHRAACRALAATKDYRPGRTPLPWPRCPDHIFGAPGDIA